MSRSSDSDDGKATDRRYDDNQDSGQTAEQLEKIRVEEQQEVERVRADLELLFATKVAPENGAKRFEAWTTVLEYAEKAVARKPCTLNLVKTSFERFLAEFPLCFGYWNKLTDIISRFNAQYNAFVSAGGDGNEALQPGGSSASAVFEVFERAVRAVPISIDLWLFYIAFAEREWRETIGLIDSEEYESRMRNLMERALRCCAFDSKAEKLWIRIIDLEMERSRFGSVATLLLRAVAIPNAFAGEAFERYQRLVAAHHPRLLLSPAEYEKLRAESDKTDEQRSQMEAEEGTNSHGSESDVNRIDENDEAFVEKLRKRCVEAARTRLEQSQAELERRAAFETPLRRTFFHVKPLESVQLSTWRAYLDYEHGVLTKSNVIDSSSQHERFILLFERCCVATAMYDQYWVEYLDSILTDFVKNSRFDPQCLTQFACLQHLFESHPSTSDSVDRNGLPQHTATLFTSAPLNRYETLKVFARGLISSVLNAINTIDARYVELIRSVSDRAVVHVGHRPFIYVRLAELFERLGDSAAACSLLEKLARDAFADNVSIRFCFIDALRRSGRHEDAEHEFDRIINARRNVSGAAEKSPSKEEVAAFEFPVEVRTSVALKFARYLLLDGHVDRSLEVLRRAVAVDPSSLRLRYALVDAHLQSYSQALAVNESAKLAKSESAIQSLHETCRSALSSIGLSFESKLEFAARYVSVCETVCHDRSQIDDARVLFRQLQRESAVVAGNHSADSATRQSNNDEPTAKRARLGSGDTKKRKQPQQQQQQGATQWNASANSVPPTGWDSASLASYYGSYGYAPYAYGAPYQAGATAGAMPTWPASAASYSSYQS